MRLYSAFVIVLLVELAQSTSNSTCLSKSLTNCNSKLQENRTSDSTFCKMIIPTTECMYEALAACKTGYETLAEKALSIQYDLCTEGTYYYNAVEVDKNCGMEILVQPCLNKDVKEPKQMYNSSKSGSNDNCKDIGSSRDCMHRKFEKCSKDTHYIFQATYDSFIELYQKVCEILS